MTRSRLSAGHKGVQPLDSMGKAMVRQERQCAIRDWGLCPKALCAKPLQHLVGPKRRVMFQQNLQRPAAHWGELPPVLPTCLVGRSQGG